MKKQGCLSRAFAVALVFSLASYPVAVPSALAGDDPNPAQTSGSENPQPVLTLEESGNQIEQTSTVVPPPPLETQTWQVDGDNPLSAGDSKAEDPVAIDPTQAQWNKLTAEEQSRVLTLLVDLENNVETADTKTFRDSLREVSAVNGSTPDGPTVTVIRATPDTVLTVFIGFLKQMTIGSTQGSNHENSAHFSGVSPSGDDDPSSFKRSSGEPSVLGARPTLPTIMERLAALSYQWDAAAKTVRKAVQRTVSSVREDGVRSDIKNLAEIEGKYRQEVLSDGFGARGFRPNREISDEDLRAAAVALSIPPRNINPFLRVMFYRNAQEFLNQATEGRREMTQWNLKMIRSSYRHEQKTLFDHYLKAMALLGAKNPVIALLNGKHPRNLFDYLSQLPK